MNVTPSLIFVNSCHWLQMCTVRVRNAHDILECVNNNLKINLVEWILIFCSGRTFKTIFREYTRAHVWNVPFNDTACISPHNHDCARERQSLTLCLSAELVRNNNEIYIGCICSQKTKQNTKCIYHQVLAAPIGNHLNWLRQKNWIVPPVWHTGIDWHSWKYLIIYV